MSDNWKRFCHANGGISLLLGSFNVGTCTFSNAEGGLKRFLLFKRGQSEAVGDTEGAQKAMFPFLTTPSP